MQTKFQSLIGQLKRRKVKLQYLSDSIEETKELIVAMEKDVKDDEAMKAIVEASKYLMFLYHIKSPIFFFIRIFC